MVKPCHDFVFFFDCKRKKCVWLRTLLRANGRSHFMLTLQELLFLYCFVLFCVCFGVVFVYILERVAFAFGPFLVFFHTAEKGKISRHNWHNFSCFCFLEVRLKLTNLLSSVRFYRSTYPSRIHSTVQCLFFFLTYM